MGCNNTEKWSVSNKTGDFKTIMDTFGVTASTARLLINRGKLTEKDIREFLYPDEGMLHSPVLMRNLEEAAAVIERKLLSGNLKFRVIGDYDADGIMSTYILYDMFQRLGAEADFYIPDRVKDGYGLNPEMIKKAKADGIDTVITCDNGIAATQAAQEAGKTGITLIITDHHELQSELPEACVIVDPKHPLDKYPCKDVCGAVVAGKLASLILERHSLTRREDGPEYLEFMAIATLCDVVPLVGENRTIASLGLKKLNLEYLNDLSKKANPGLKALIDLCGIRGEITDYSVGFVIGPCLNATGRLDIAAIAMDMLTSSTTEEARRLAGECISLNEARKQLTSEWTQKAFDILDSREELDKVLVVELPACHESIAGIIAGRIKEKYYRPVFVLTDSKDGMKGSGRSIPGYNMFEEMMKVCDLFSKFGGHPMAAGLSLSKENVKAFKERINAGCMLNDEDFKKKVLMDAVVAISCFDEQSLKEMKLFAPFGPGNPSPVFGDRRNKVLRIKRIGKDNSFLKFSLEDGRGQKFEAVCFKNAEACIGQMIGKFGRQKVDDAFAGKDTGICIDVCYVPEINEYNGIRNIQMKISGIKL